MPKACSVPNCWKKFKNHGKCSMFQVPQDETSRRIWGAAIPGMKVLKPTHYVCERHFEPECIIKKLLTRDRDGRILIDIPYKRPRLMESAVPSIFDCGSVANRKNDKDNSTTGVTKVASLKSASDCLAPKTVTSRTIDNQQAVTFVEPVMAKTEQRPIHTTGVTKVASLKSASDCLAPKTVTSRTIDNQQAVTFVEPVMAKTEQRPILSQSLNSGTTRNNKDKIAPSVQAADKELQSLNQAKNINSIKVNPSVKMKHHGTSDDQLLTFSVSDASQINFQTGVNICTVSLSKPWSVVLSSMGQKLILSEIVTNAACNDVAVILKSVVIDNNKKIKYAVHGKPITHELPQLPQVLTDFKILPRILDDFHRLRICAGLTHTNVHLAEAAAACTDNMNINRSTNCMLIGEKKTCHYCVRLRKTLRQKKIRWDKRGSFKRLTVLSNPVDEKKITSMRMKINRERRAKNRRTQRIKMLSRSSRQKRDAFLSIKDHVSEKPVAALSIPDFQKTASQEIIAAAQHTDPRGRRYRNEWIMCMLMSARSPACYEITIKNQIVPSPCITTVRNHLSVLNSNRGFDEKFFELLKLKFELKEPMQRHGLLVCDGISLRKSLTASSKDVNDQAGLVLLLQSLVDKSTQPLAVFDCKNAVESEELAKLMVKAITLLDRSGARIHGIVADKAQTNTKVGTSLGVDRSIENCKS